MFLRKLWAKVEEKLGRFSAFVPLIGKQIAFDLEEENYDAAAARVKELREAAASLIVVCDKVDASIADRSVDAVELGGIAGAIDDSLDEFEDVLKGYDEDDPAPAGG